MGDVKSLAAKMAAIMGEVPTMEKNGYNQQQKYGFVTAEDIKAFMRPLFRKYKIALFSSMVDVERTTAQNKNGNTVVTVVAKMLFTLVDGESGEEMECIWHGEANDYADKAVNKAATAAEKYWLINTFLLSTSEAESDEEEVKAPPPPNPRLALWKNINDMGTGLYGDAWTETRKELIARYAPGAVKPGDITPEQMQAIWKHLERDAESDPAAAYA